MNKILLTFSLVLPLVANAQLMDDKEKKGLSIIPVVAANSTYGLMLGGAGMYYMDLADYHRIYAIGVTTLEDQRYILSGWDAHGEVWKYGFQLQVINFFKAYYGDSREPRKEDPDRISQKRVVFEPYISYRFTPKFAMTGVVDYKLRKENNRVERAIDDSVDHIQIYPNDRTWALGLNFTWDERQLRLTSPIGGFYESKLRYMPGSIATNQDHPDPFFKATLDLRYIWELSESLYYAQRLFFGESLGEPTYEHRYFFGGEPTMRGFGYSRFSGYRFYLSQSEARFPIYKVLGGVTFLDMGDVVDHDYISLLYSYGFGLRINLPPDYVAKLRLDFGFGTEGMNFSMRADHVF